MVPRDRGGPVPTSLANMNLNVPVVEIIPPGNQRDGGKLLAIVTHDLPGLMVIHPQKNRVTLLNVLGDVGLADVLGDGPEGHPLKFASHLGRLDLRFVSQRPKSLPIRIGPLKLIPVNEGDARRLSLVVQIPCQERQEGTTDPANTDHLDLEHVGLCVQRPMSKVTSVRVRLGPAFERQRPSLFLFTTCVLQSSVFDVGLRTSDLGPLFKWRRAGHWDRNHPEGELASPLPNPRGGSSVPTATA